MKQMKITFINIVIAFFIFCFIDIIHADSFYSSIGLGIPNYFVSQKASGMGSTGIGVVDRFALNAINPAAINIYGLTTISINSYFNMSVSKISDRSVVTRNGYPSGFFFIVPLKRNILLLSSVKSLTSSKYTLSLNQSNENVNYTRLVRGNGGLSSGSLGLQYQISDKLYIGALGNFIFGTFNEEWKTLFDDESYLDTSDDFVTHLWGISFDIGIYVSPLSNLGVGAVYKSKSLLHLENNLTLGNTKKTDPVTSERDYPSSVGFGISYKVSKILMAVDYYMQSWDQFKDNHVTRYPNFNRLGAGFEYLDTNDALAKYHRRVAYRAGVYFSQLPFEDVTGNPVNEKFISIGLGLPFHKFFGRVDFAIEAGLRGNASENSYQDTVIRFSGSITGSELWFQRRH
ncbi:hypothetical protein JXQ31_12905 [candidate division KSB1 bacterium]|nr:hypothetical protein [candidate division KSB1 bacterium]